MEVQIRELKIKDTRIKVKEGRAKQITISQMNYDYGLAELEICL